MTQVQQQCIAAYRQHQNLKIAARQVGIPWQTMYVHLRRAGEPVTGNKMRYGSDSDRLAARAERRFLELVKFAKDQNTKEYQSKVDFLIGDLGIDVKSSRLRPAGPHTKVKRWSYSIKKQEAIADFFVCLGFDEGGTIHINTLLIPGEIVRRLTSISHSENGGKWSDYAIDPDDLAHFFRDILK